MFICRKQGCGKEAKAGCDGLCLPHALEEIKARHSGAAVKEPESYPTGRELGIESDTYGPVTRPPEPETSRECPCGAPLNPKATGDKCEDCRRKEAQARYLAKKKGLAAQAEGPTEKVMDPKTCDECKREMKEGERLYKGKCKDCRGKGKDRGSGRGGGRGKAAEKSKDNKVYRGEDHLVGKLLAKHNDLLEQLTEVRKVLVGIRNLTGEDFEIPEMEI